jgi:hypothetical protein
MVIFSWRKRSPPAAHLDVIMPEIDGHRQRCPKRAAAVASIWTGCIARILEAAMCHWSSYEHERRLHTDPTRSFFQALRDLFRRTRPPQVKAPEVQAEVIPLRAKAAERKVDRPVSGRADAA